MKEYICREIPKDDKRSIFFHTETVGDLIRCKDCKHWYQDFDGKCIASTPYGTDTDEDDFCSRAERREDADK